MTCKLCERFWDRFWTYSERWERAASNDAQLISAESKQIRELIRHAQELEDADAGSAFQLYLQAAEEGSAWAMGKIGWCCWTGTGVAADRQRALEYYHRAIGAGSWMATIPYARLLAEVGRHADCDRVLESGVASDFVPAYYWLAWYRYKQSRTPATRREVRSLLEYAAEKGHPGAERLLSRWMMFGKFGLREIPRGWRLAIHWVASSASGMEQIGAS